MVAGLLVVVTLGVAGVWWRNRGMARALAPPLVASGGAPSSTASPASPGKTLTWAEMPMSSTTSDVARQAFRRGMTLCASGESPIPALDEALAADPAFASAGLQRAFVGFCYARPLIAADRQAYRVALTHREALSPEEQALLDALGPSFGDPPDWKESERRIRVRLLAKPDEPETWDALATILMKEYQYKEATAAFAREAELAPSDVWGHDVWAQLLTTFGDFDGARRVIADCNARRPANLHCRRREVYMTSELGDCKLADQLAREITAVSPADHEGWSLRARLGVSLGLSEEALGVLETTAQSYSPAAVRAVSERQAQFDRAWRHGDFAACDRLSAEAQRTASPSDGGDPQQVLLQLDALWESGDKAEVSRVARATLARLPALAVAERPGDDLTPRLLSFLIDAGAADAEALRARRSQWLDQQRQRLGEAAWPDARFGVWAHAYRLPGEPSRAQSDEAIARLADVGGHLSDWPVRSSASIGALLLGAGRPQEAEPWLSKAVHECLDQPDLPATYLLGRVYEDEGDNARACASYAAVLGAWGRATPRSVTADLARAHAKKLGCAP
jgi:tetratricopeptide (TPR) repeat protein